MKRVLAVGIWIITVALALHAADPKKRVAVLDFEYGAVKTAADAVFGQSVDVGKGMSSLLVKHLVQDGTYAVIERRMLDKVLAEQNFANSNRADPSSAARIGKILGVDAIIVGTITQFGHENKSTNIGGAAGGLIPFGVGRVGRKTSKAIVSVDARMVDTETGEILGVAEGKGESSRSSTSLLGGGGTWGGFGAGGVDFGTSGFQETIIGEAVKASMVQLVQGIIGASAKLPTRTVTVQALVAFVEGFEVVVNAGTGSGIKVGDRLSVERLRREIKDPATGAVIRRLSDSIGIIEVAEVDASSSVCKVVSGAGFKVGDIAKTPTGDAR